VSHPRHQSNLRRTVVELVGGTVKGVVDRSFSTVFVMLYVNKSFGICRSRNCVFETKLALRVVS